MSTAIAIFNVLMIITIIALYILKSENPKQMLLFTLSVITILAFITGVIVKYV